MLPPSLLLASVAGFMLYRKPVPPRRRCGERSPKISGVNYLALVIQRRPCVVRLTCTITICSREECSPLRVPSSPSWYDQRLFHLSRNIMSKGAATSSRRSCFGCCAAKLVHLPG